MLQVVAVDRADVIEAQLLEQSAAAGDDAAGVFLGLLRGALERRRQDLAECPSRRGAASGTRSRTASATDTRCSAPTGGAIDMSLSLRMTIRRVSREPALFIAS